MNKSIWIRRRGKVNGPFPYQQVMAAIKSGKVESTDEVARTSDGPWTTVEKSLRPKESVESLPSKSNTQPSLYAITESIEPIELIQTTARSDFERNTIVIHQLDISHFLIEGMSVSEVFDRLAIAAASDHSVTGSFPKSGLIRGSGKSGLEFVLTVMLDPRGVTFLVEGKTQQGGAANIGVLFDPLSLKGWGVATAVGLFSAAVEYTVAADVSTLMVNLLESLGASELLMNKSSGSVNVGPEKQRLIALSQKVSALAGYKLASDEVSKILKCERAAVTLLRHNMISTRHPLRTLILTISRLLKSLEAEAPQGIIGVGKAWRQLTGRSYIYNVTLERSTNTVTVYSSQSSAPILISVHGMTSTLSLVLVTSDRSPKHLKNSYGAMHRMHCNQESFIRDAIAEELQARMS